MPQPQGCGHRPEEFAIAPYRPPNCRAPRRKTNHWRCCCQEIKQQSRLSANYIRIRVCKTDNTVSGPGASRFCALTGRIPYPNQPTHLTYLPDSESPAEPG